MLSGYWLAPPIFIYIRYTQKYAISLAAGQYPFIQHWMAVIETKVNLNVFNTDALSIIKLYGHDVYVCNVCMYVG